MNPADLKIERAYPTRPGGQSVGLGRPDIKVTHVPSGITAIVGTEYSQSQNRNLAISMIEWAIANSRQKWLNPS